MYMYRSDVHVQDSLPVHVDSEPTCERCDRPARYEMHADGMLVCVGHLVSLPAEYVAFTPLYE